MISTDKVAQVLLAFLYQPQRIYLNGIRSIGDIDTPGFLYLARATGLKNSCNTYLKEKLVVRKHQLQIFLQLFFDQKRQVSHIN